MAKASQTIKKYFKKADAFLLAGILLFSLAGFVLMQKSSDANSLVEISVDGQIIKRFALSSNTEYKVTSELGNNTVHIEAGYVWVDESDCPNHDCMRFGKISNEGQVIICMPHKLLVKISGNGGHDAISY